MTVLTAVSSPAIAISMQDDRSWKEESETMKMLVKYVLRFAAVIFALIAALFAAMHFDATIAPTPLWIPLVFAAEAIGIWRLSTRKGDATRPPSDSVAAGSRAATPGGHVAIGPAPVKIDGLNVDLLLTYRDGAGKATSRQVTLRGADGHVAQNGSIMVDDVRGYCHLRRMARTFRTDRIVTATDLDGVVIEDLNAWILAKVPR